MLRFADNLRNMRLARGLTQMQLAEGLNTSQSAITSWENSQREPDFRTIQKIADYFHVPMSALLPSDDSIDKDHVAVIADNITSNEKLSKLFDIVRFFSNADLDAMIGIASSIRTKYGN